MVYSVDWKYYSCLCVPLTTPMSARCLCLSANTQHDVSPASAGGRMMLRWGKGCRRTRRQPPKANISIFNTAARPTRTSVTVFAWQTGFLALVHRGWSVSGGPFGHAAETHVSLSCISRFSAALWQRYQWSARWARNETEPESMWKTGALRAWEQREVNRILNAVMFFDRDWT